MPGNTVRHLLPFQTSRPGLSHFLLNMKRKFSSLTGKVGKSSRRYKKARTATQVANAVVARYPGLVRAAGSYGKYGGNALSSGLKPELKFFDTAMVSTIDQTAEFLFSLNLIPQGDTESSRDGRSAVIRSIQIRGDAVFSPAAAGVAATNIEMWCVLDTQANGANAAFTDVFNSNTVQTTLLNLNNSGRFRILWHKTIEMNAMAGVTTAYNDTRKHFEFYKRVNIPIDWSSTTGAITEVRSNNIIFLAGAAGSDDTVALNANARVRFQG